MKTRQTKPGWGIVALISVMVACTCFGSMWLTGISTALFAFSAWRGGYMDASTGSAAKHHNQPAAAGERRAA